MKHLNWNWIITLVNNIIVINSSYILLNYELFNNSLVLIYIK